MFFDLGVKLPYFSGYQFIPSAEMDGRQTALQPVVKMPAATRSEASLSAASYQQSGASVETTPNRLFSEFNGTPAGPKWALFRWSGNNSQRSYDSSTPLKPELLTLTSFREVTEDPEIITQGNQFSNYTQESRETKLPCLKELINACQLEKQRLILKQNLPAVESSSYQQKNSNAEASFQWLLVNPEGKYSRLVPFCFNCGKAPEELRQQAVEANKELYNLIKKTWDEHAAIRFKKLYGWRQYQERPISVGELQNFVREEEQWRAECYDIDTILNKLKGRQNNSSYIGWSQSQNQPVTLDSINNHLSTLTSLEKQKIIIGTGPLSESRGESELPFDPQLCEALTLSSQQLGVVQESYQNSIQGGIKRLRAFVEDALDPSLKNYPVAKKHILTIFDQEFNLRMRYAYPMTVVDVHDFLVHAIAIRDRAQSILHQWSDWFQKHEKAFVETIKGDLNAIFTYIKKAYEAVGEAAAGAIICAEIQSAHDPITAVIKALSSTAIVSYESTPERIMSAALLYSINQGSFRGGISDCLIKVFNG